MKIGRLYIQNFLSVGNEAIELFFSEQNGITHISGRNYDVSQMSSNGSGKSTIIEAIIFALKGTTLRKLTQNDIVHNKSEGKCRVEIEFDNVKIVRKLKPNSVEMFIDGVRVGTDSSILEVRKEIDRKLDINLEALVNILVFGQHNLVSFLDATAEEKRRIVENLTNLAEYNGFEAKARENVKSIKTQLKILQETYTVKSTHLAENIKMKQEQDFLLHQYREAIKEDIRGIQTRLDKIPNIEFLRDEWNRFNESEKQRANLLLQITNAQAEKNDIISQINSVFADKTKEMEEKQPLLDKKNAYQTAKKSIADRKVEIEASTILPLKQSLSDMDENIRQLNTLYRQKIDNVSLSTNWDVLINTAKKEAKTQKESYDGIRNKKLTHNEQCPNCFGVIDINNCENVLKTKEKEIQQKLSEITKLETSKQNDIDAVSAKKKEIEEELTVKRETLWVDRQEIAQQIKEKTATIETQCEEALAQVSTKLEAINLSITYFDENIENKYGPKLSSLENRKNQLIQNISALEKQKPLIMKVPQPSLTLEELAVLQTRAEEDKKKLAEKNKALTENPYAQILESLSANIDKANLEIKDTEKNIRESEKELPYYEYWVSAFGQEGIKSFVIEHIIPILNQQIEYWMNLIYGGSFSVFFDKFLNVKLINNTSGNEIIFGQGSGGERRRIDLAIMLAFRQVMQMSCGKTPNIMFMDEPVENLDEDGINSFYKVLTDMAKTTGVFVITHNEYLLNLLNNTNKIKLEKRNGATRLVS